MSRWTLVIAIWLIASGAAQVQRAQPNARASRDSDQVIAGLLRQIQDSAAMRNPAATARLYGALGDAWVASSQAAELPANRARQCRQAIEAYQRGAATAALASDFAGQAGLLGNAATAADKAGLSEQAASLLGGASLAVGRITNAEARRSAGLAVAAGWMTLGDGGKAAAALQEIRGQAAEAHDARNQSYAEGYLGALAEQAHDWGPALAHTRQALRATLQTGESSAIFRWEWQLARIHRAAGDPDQAVPAYEGALSAAERLNMESEPQAIQLEYVDLLLERSHRYTSPVRQQDLQKARAVLISRHQSELTAYYGDDCAYRELPRAIELEAAAKSAAILYPVVLPGRVEVLFSKDGSLDSYVVAASPSELQAQAARFREFVEKRTTLEYEEPARQLYRLLIGPLEERIGERGVKTLVFVPDGSLRRIPLAALRTGNEFLIERYAVAVSPGLKLTGEPPSIQRAQKINAALLAAGLSIGKPTFPALTFVPSELTSAAESFQRHSTLLNGQFRVDRLGSRYRQRDYAVVHIASHARFAPSAGSSVIITGENRNIGLGDLDRLLQNGDRRRPLDLIVLSACETAVGDDDRAALGLGGIAVEAGARSAVATFWHINDRAASELIQHFYSKLFQPGVNKAEALQFAQRECLKDPWLRHPAYWAAFLLINDWR